MKGINAIGGKKIHYLITGGGTGGHVYPAIAIANELRRKNPRAQFLYVGVKKRAEERIVPHYGYPLATVPTKGFPGGKNPFKLLDFSLHLFAGILKASILMLRFKPDVVIGAGGYVSAPTVFSAILLRKLGLWEGKIFIHEQNVVPGKLNQLVGKLADVLGITFDETSKFMPSAKLLKVGYPVRAEIGKVPREQARLRVKISAEEKLIFVFGGSLGSRTINRAIVDALPELSKLENIKVIHATGRKSRGEYDPATDTEKRLSGLKGDFPFYRKIDYADDIQWLYAAADLVVCRGGAGTLSELAKCGLPAVIIPKSNLPHDHQVRNACVMSAHGSAEVIYEGAFFEEGKIIEKVEGSYLASVVKELLASEGKLKQMEEAAKKFGSLHSVEKIVATIEKLSKGETIQVPPFAPSFKMESVIENKLATLEGEALVNYLREVENSGVRLLPPQRRYLQYRADGYLSSKRWQIRNVGVKLVGLTRWEERIPLLIEMFTSRKRVNFLLRMLGGDFVEVGFIRRNIIRAIIHMGVYSEDIRGVLLAGMKDPYYEVRACCASAVQKFSSYIKEDNEIKNSLLELCQERNFEVKREAVRALPAVCRDRSIIETLRQFYYHPNWKVRDAAVEAILTLVDNGVLEDFESVKKEIDLILSTCSGFIPSFPLRERIHGVMQAVKKKEAPAP